jgi:hypothetical protein
MAPRGGVLNPSALVDYQAIWLLLAGARAARGAAGPRRIVSAIGMLAVVESMVLHMPLAHHVPLTAEATHQV